jgi:hypothetical protein
VWGRKGGAENFLNIFPREAGKDEFCVTVRLPRRRIRQQLLRDAKQTIKFQKICNEIEKHAIVEGFAGDRRGDQKKRQRQRMIEAENKFSASTKNCATIESFADQQICCNAAKIRERNKSPRA